jgi:transcriptional regulator with XRE-family HTH domain
MALTQNQIKSIELLLSGMAQNQVAQELGVTPKTLQRWAKIPEYGDKLNRILKDATEQATKQATETVKQKTIDNIAALGDRDALRQEQYKILVIAQNALMRDIEEGDHRAISVLIKLSESIRLLYGLNVKNDILSAFEVLVKAEILPYRYLNKFKEYSYQYEKKIKGIGEEPPNKISYSQSMPADDIERELKDMMNWKF